MQTLDARDPNQVASASQIDADLGVGGRRLLVLSGIALTSWELDSDETSRGATKVRLGVYARNLEQWSAFVGLASIANDETAFVFATDTARVELDQNSGELSLIFNTALMGEPSALNRVSYQVVVTVVRVTPHIAGTITWPKSLFTPPSRDVSTVASQLTVMANRHERITPQGAFPYDKLTPVAPGQIVRLDIGPNDCVAHYRIDNPPMALPLKVTVDAGPAFRTNAPGTVVVGRVAGPDVFTLTGGAPSVDGLNFAVGVIVVR